MRCWGCGHELVAEGADVSPRAGGVGREEVGEVQVTADAVFYVVVGLTAVVSCMAGVLWSRKK